MKPITRVELRLMKGPPRWVKLGGLETWLITESNAFGDLRFAERLSAKFITPMQKLKAEHFERLVQDDGFVLARKKITSQFKKAKRESSFGAVFGAWRTRKKFRLDLLFQKALKVFMSAPLDPAEESMLAKLEHGTVLAGRDRR